VKTLKLTEGHMDVACQLSLSEVFANKTLRDVCRGFQSHVSCPIVWHLKPVAHSEI